ncbi:MAG: hypothetical protein KDD82_03215 [Planctomycetes bacterium]|nr:hypothetical protein [Planctomycetota bacterium]
MLSEIPVGARHVAHLVRLRTAGRFHKDLRAISDRFGVDWKHLALACVSYDLTLAAFGCSTVALAGVGGPVVARNLDWWPEEPLARSTYLVREIETGRCLRATAGWPGSIGVVTGLSSNGFALVLNAVSGPEGVSLTGYPVLLHLRRVLEDAADFDAALVMLRDTHLAAPCLISLVGVENHQRVVIERSPKRHALRWAEGISPLVATNDYRKLFPPETREGSPIYETTCARFEALDLLGAEIAEAGADPTDEELLGVLTDPDVLQTITVQHVVMRPHTNTIKVWIPELYAADPNTDGS